MKKIRFFLFLFMLLLFSRSFCLKGIYRITQFPRKYRRIRTDFRRYKQLEKKLYNKLDNQTQEEKLNNITSLIQQDHHNITTHPYSLRHFYGTCRGERIRTIWYAWKETKEK